MGRILIGNVRDSVINNLNMDTPGRALDAMQGKILNDNKLEKSSVVNSLSTTAEGHVLDARQGKALNDGKLDKTNVVNNLTTTAAGCALDARQGKALNDGKLNSANVLNNLTTTASGNALDARQGKALNDKITALNNNLTLGSIITLGSQNGITAYYRKNAYSVIVYINGTCNHGSLASGGEIVLGTLPAGARPSYKIYSYITGDLVLAVHTTGNVVLRNERWEAISPNGWAMQQGIAFMV